MMFRLATKMEKSKKAQSVIEFMVLTMGFFFFFLFLVAIVQKDIGEKTRIMREEEAKSVTFMVQEEINLASVSSDGYTRNFFIPEKIINHEYEIKLVEGFVYLQLSDGKFSMALPVKTTTGDLNKGENTIRKVNGEINVNKEN
jgi:Na+-transporting methylmalonyl-CoA/oxaloacetate decarboxylase gamma subunit